MQHSGPQRIFRILGGFCTLPHFLNSLWHTPNRATQCRAHNVTADSDAFSWGCSNALAWLPLQSLAVKKKIVQILGGAKLLKFVEKCR